MIYLFWYLLGYVSKRHLYVCWEYRDSLSFPLAAGPGSGGVARGHRARGSAEAADRVLDPAAAAARKKGHRHGFPPTPATATVRARGLVEVREPDLKTETNGGHAIVDALPMTMMTSTKKRACGTRDPPRENGQNQAQVKNTGECGTILSGSPSSVTPPAPRRVAYLKRGHRHSIGFASTESALEKWGQH